MFEEEKHKVRNVFLGSQQVSIWKKGEKNPNGADKDKKTESRGYKHTYNHVFGSHCSDKEPRDPISFLVIEQDKLSSPNRQQRFLT